MNNQLKNNITSQFPSLFVKANGRDSIRYISCGQGWSQIILNLSKKLDGLVRNSGVDEADWPKVIQIKEKFGKLCYYVNGDAGIENFHTTITEAEALANKCCENCSESDLVETKAWGTTSWQKTLCQSCGDKYSKDGWKSFEGELK